GDEGHLRLACPAHGPYQGFTGFRPPDEGVQGPRRSPLCGRQGRQADGNSTGSRPRGAGRRRLLPAVRLQPGGVQKYTPTHHPQLPARLATPALPLATSSAVPRPHLVRLTAASTPEAPERRGVNPRPSFDAS